MTKFSIIYTRHVWQYLYYRKWGKICWAKLSHFSEFSGVPRQFFCEYKRLSLIVLNNEHQWPKQCKSISVETLIVLKQWLLVQWIFPRLRYILKTSWFQLVYMYLCSSIKCEYFYAFKCFQAHIWQYVMVLM